MLLLHGIHEDPNTNCQDAVISLLASEFVTETTGVRL